MTAVGDLAKHLSTKDAPHRWRQGSVVTVNTDGTVDLTLAGSTAVIPGVTCLADIGVYVDATVWCAQIPGDLFVVGVQEPATGWSTVTTEFTAATNWSLTSARWRRQGTDADLTVVLARTTSALAVGAGDGNISNVDVLNVIPIQMIPKVTSYAVAASTGRTLTAAIATNGVVSITSVAGDGTNIIVGESISLHARYWVD